MDVQRLCVEVKRPLRGLQNIKIRFLMLGRHFMTHERYALSLTVFSGAAFTDMAVVLETRPVFIAECNERWVAICPARLSVQTNP